MFLPLVDILRCPNAHDETWLVASIDRADDRDIITGALGCPSCLAEYPIRDGIVYFSTEQTAARYEAPSEQDAVRLAAALDLTEARMTAVLHGSWGSRAPVMRGLTSAHLLLINPPTAIVSGDGISIVYADAAPFARNSVNAVAFDGAASEIMRASLVASVRPNGRVLGPLGVPIPSELVELARDDDVWVAQLGSSPTTSAPIALKRRGDPA